MSKIFSALASLGVALFFLQGCEKPVVREIPEHATPTPALKETASAPVPAEPFTDSVEGKDAVYLAQRVSIITDEGIRGFKVGTKVYVLEHKGNVLTVAVEKVKFDVAAEATTRNKEVVQALLPQQQKKDASISQLQSQLAQQANDQKTQQEIDLQKAKQEHQQTVQRQRAAEITRIIAADRTKIAQLQELNNNRSTVRSYTTTGFNGYQYQTYGTNKETPEAKARRLEIQRLYNEIADLQAEQFQQAHTASP